MLKTIFTLADFVKGMPNIIKMKGDEYLILSVSDDGKTYSVNENDEQVWSYEGNNPEFFAKHINDIIASRTAY
jgi:outer membrane protein assembly factor BamB